MGEEEAHCDGDTLKVPLSEEEPVLELQAEVKELGEELGLCIMLAETLALPVDEAEAQGVGVEVGRCDGEALTEPLSEGDEVLVMDIDMVTVPVRENVADDVDEIETLVEVLGETPAVYDLPLLVEGSGVELTVGQLLDDTEEEEVPVIDALAHTVTDPDAEPVAVPVPLPVPVGVEVPVVHPVALCVMLSVDEVLTEPEAHSDAKRDADAQPLLLDVVVVLAVTEAEPDMLA